MRTSLTQVAAAVARRQAALTSETAGYIALLAIRRLNGAWRRVEGTDLVLTRGGQVEVCGGVESSQVACEGCIRAILGQLLECCRSPTPSLAGLSGAGRAPSSMGLESELLSALIPLNESAALRGLARLCREIERSSGGSSSQTLSQEDSCVPVSGTLLRSSPTRTGLSATLPLGSERGTEVLSELEKLECSDWEELGLPSSRSDLGSLLEGYLAASDDERELTRGLRRMIGLDEL